MCVVAAGTLALLCAPAVNAADAGDPFAARLEASVKELAALRDGIAAEKIPASEQLAGAEEELSAARAENADARRKLDKLALDVSTLRTGIDARRHEATYLSSLLGEYSRNLESRLHIAELAKYGPILEEARLALANDTLTEEERFEKQFSVLSESIARVEDLLGGMIFEGRAAGPDGLVKQGRFAHLGPVAYFSADDGSMAGIVEQRIGSLEPSVMPFLNPQMAVLTAKLVADGGGPAPVDSSLGNARKVEETQETLWEHIVAGGAVMWPILALAVVLVLIIVCKFLQLSLVSVPGTRRLQPVYNAIRAGDYNRARGLAKNIKGMAGGVLNAGLKRLGESSDLIEEGMYEKLLAVRHKLYKYISFLAVGAAVEPLLGLLGTVTGIITTFKMLTIFGSGDIRQLSGGISEALITTEWGLIVAIPTLLCHAFLSRKAEALLGGMEQISLNVMSEVERSEEAKKEAKK